ncbi:MAG: HAMP domain-containing protein [Bacteroidetes bacterium]|nr:HAMP domain-containing protein [Bacteroidota bacterium]
MTRTIKSKIALGIGALFVLLLTISTVSFVFINLLSHRTENLLTANYKTIQYCNQMMHAINAVSLDSNALSAFEKNLQLQESNITEPGEQPATQKLRLYFELIKKNAEDSTVIDSINRQLYDIALLNQHALEKKNQKALTTAGAAKLWISLLTSVLVLISFTLLINFPGYIASPIKLLTEGIKEIAQKNYNKRIYINNNDEFGEMASAFNQMAEKLYEYENSSINQLMFEKQRVETIINQMTDAVIGLDSKNKILFINNTAQQLLNLKADEIKGRYAPDVALRNDLFRFILQKNSRQEPLKIVVDGKENYFSIDNKTVYSEEKTIGEVFILKNITQFKELDISKTNLLATISHELKTPISSIKMSAKLISDERTGSLNQEQEELVNNIKEDTERLLKLTGELLNMTQIETGNIQLKLQKVYPGEIIETSLRSVQTQAQQKEIALKITMADNLPYIMADADKTSWVLINILSNAIKYSNPASPVTVSVDVLDDMAQFSIKDNGPGIDEKYLGRIFERYFKVPGSEQTGSGLGLAISKEFIEAQGGTINFLNNPEKGALVKFSLPLAVD